MVWRNLLLLTMFIRSWNLILWKNINIVVIIVLFSDFFYFYITIQSFIQSFNQFFFWLLLIKYLNLLWRKKNEIITNKKISLHIYHTSLSRICRMHPNIIGIMGNSIIGHTNHKDNHIIENITWRHTHKEIKLINISATNTLWRPWTMMVIVTNADITLSAMVGLALLICVAFLAVSMGI